MYPFFETMAVEDGQIINILDHQKHYEFTLKHFYQTQYQAINISDITIPKEFTHGLVRCRMNYNATCQQILFFPYQRKEIHHFQVVMADDLDYSFKFTRRSKLERLLEQKGICDEVIIVKNQHITDCTIGNLVFKKQGQWWTPDTPLLHGTQRAKLIKEGIIIPIKISLNILDKFEEIRMINALNPLRIT